MGGKSANAIPGSFTRLGPTKRNGDARSDHTGSSRIFSPAVCISMLACPTYEMRKTAPSTRVGGRSRYGDGAHTGHFALGARHLRSMCQRSKSRLLLGGAPCGSKKHSPSK